MTMTNYDYRTPKTAAEIPSLEQFAHKWAEQVADAILKVIPSRYKQDIGKIMKGKSAGYIEVLCQGTSVRDLDVEISVGFIVDVMRGETMGIMTWEEVGSGKQRVDINVRHDQPGSDIIDLVKRMVQQNERG